VNDGDGKNESAEKTTQEAYMPGVSAVFGMDSIQISCFIHHYTPFPRHLNANSGQLPHFSLRGPFNLDF
jgi:hypothetical protein